MPDRPIVLLCAEGRLADICANGLGARFPDLVTIREPAESKKAIIRRRARLLGWPTALSQAAAGVVTRLGAARAAARRHEIERRHGLDPAPQPEAAVHRVASVNGDDCRDLLRALAPAVVAVYGTRIITAKTLHCVAAPFINYHAGINPKYRGQHPAYWALAARDPRHAGITIHLVDEGVDTGDVIAQETVEFSPADTIATYQTLQMAHALPLFAEAIAAARAGKLRTRTVDLPSRQWFPPTLGQYFVNGLLRGVW